VIGYGLENQISISSMAREFLFSTIPRLPLGLLSKLVTGTLSPGVKQAKMISHFYLETTLRLSGDIVSFLRHFHGVPLN
jgi:hypothetical protein